MWMTELVDRRSYGLVRCSIVSAPNFTMTNAFLLFGFVGEEGGLKEIQPDEAASVLETIVSRSLVDGLEIVPIDDSRRMVSEFMNYVSVGPIKFYTNGDWGESRLNGWNSMTQSIFDSGIIVLGEKKSACVWIEEDA